jgi:hypothetical protein
MPRRNGSVIGLKNNTTVNTASGIYALNTVLEESAGNNFPGGILITWNTASGTIRTIGDAARGLTSQSVSANASLGGLAYSITSGSLPPGMSLNSNNGEITGTPNAVGSNTTYTFTISANSVVKPSVSVTRSFSIAVNAPQVIAYGFTGGDQTFTVPSGVTHVQLKIWGAGGGSGWGGGGGYAGGIRAVNSGESYTVRVGGSGGGGCSGQCSGNSQGGGFGGGGGAYEGNGGGGGSYVFFGGTSHGNIIAAAGGGGGGGGGSSYQGGAGGGSTGQSGNGAGCQGGFGGTQSAGGAGAPCTNGGSTYSGSAMQGAGSNYGGGGGGGYFGGGSGNRQGGWQHTAGGGGSGFVGGLISGTTSNTVGSGTTPGNSGDGDRAGAATNNGNGRIVVRY